MSQISKLVAAIKANADIVEQELLRAGQPEPSDLASGPVAEFPPIGPKGAKARIALLSAIHDLDRIVQSPVEYFRNFGQHSIESGCIRTLVAFNIPEMIPLKGRATYDELSQRSGLSPVIIRSLVRASILSVGFLTEDAEGRVGHTITSAIFHPDKQEDDRADALRYMYYSMLNCGANLQNALLVDPSAQDDHASAFSLAHKAYKNGDGTLPNFWQYLEKNPEMAKWFHGSMRIVATYPARSTKFLVDVYDWANLHGKTVVELGGSTGQISAAIAEKHPSINFIAQDLAEAIEESASAPVLPPNVTLEVASFFEPQKTVADAYLLRTIFHSWSDSAVAVILRNLLPALRPGARLIVEEMVLPSHNPPAVPPYAERIFVRTNVIMAALFNGRERAEEEFVQIVEDALPGRFVYMGAKKGMGAVYSVMEWVFEPNGDGVKGKVVGNGVKR